MKTRTLLFLLVLLATTLHLHAISKVDVAGVYTGTAPCRRDANTNFELTLLPRVVGMDAEVQIVRGNGVIAGHRYLTGDLDERTGKFTLGTGDRDPLDIEGVATRGSISIVVPSCGEARITLKLDADRSRPVKREAGKRAGSASTAAKTVKDARGKAEICAAFVQWARRVIDEFPPQPPRNRGPMTPGVTSFERQFMVLNLFEDRYFESVFGTRYEAMSPRERGKRGDQLDDCYRDRILGGNHDWIREDVRRFFYAGKPEMSQRFAELRARKAALQSAIAQLRELEPSLASVEAALGIAREQRTTLPFIWPEEARPFREEYAATLTRISGVALAELVTALANKSPSADSIQALRAIARSEATIESKERPPREPEGWRDSSPSLRSPAEAPTLGDSENLFDWAPSDLGLRQSARAADLAVKQVAQLTQRAIDRLDDEKGTSLDRLEKSAEAYDGLVRRFGSVLVPAERLQLTTAFSRHREPLLAAAFGELHEQMRTATARADIRRVVSDHLREELDKNTESGRRLLDLSQFYLARRMVDPCGHLTASGSSSSGEPQERDMCEAIWDVIATRNERERTRARECPKLVTEGGMMEFATQCLTGSFFGLAGEVKAELIRFEKGTCRAAGEETYYCSYSLRWDSDNPLFSAGARTYGFLGDNLAGDFIRRGGRWTYRRRE